MNTIKRYFHYFRSSATSSESVQCGIHVIISALGNLLEGVQHASGSPEAAALEQVMQGLRIFTPRRPNLISPWLLTSEHQASAVVELSFQIILCLCLDLFIFILLSLPSPTPIFYS